jgi:hypothetical protein
MFKVLLQGFFSHTTKAADSGPYRSGLMLILVLMYVMKLVSVDLVHLPENMQNLQRAHHWVGSALMTPTSRKRIIDVT